MLSLLTDAIILAAQWLFGWVLYELLALLWGWLATLWVGAGLPTLTEAQWNVITGYMARVNYWVPVGKVYDALSFYLNWRLVLTGLRLVIRILRG